MPYEVFDFRWPVPESGHSWIQAKTVGSDTPVWALTDNLAVGGQYRIKMYSPFVRHPVLYKNFASLDTSDRDNVLRFADAYGMLGNGQPTDMPVDFDEKNALRTLVEPWETWNQEVLAMRRAVAIQDMLDSGDVDGISKVVYWKDGACFYHSRGHTGADHREPGDSWELIEPVEDLFRPNDVRMPARFLVQRWINKHLVGNVGPQLRYDVRIAKQVMKNFPTTLLSAMWFQFADAVAGNRKHRICPICGTWFEVAPTGVSRTKNGGGPGRMNRVFCSDPCKSKDYRDRKDEARRLKSQGKTVATIAKQLDTPVETIKTWTTKRKGK
jgi:hypothetical protein